MTTEKKYSGKEVAVALVLFIPIWIYSVYVAQYTWNIALVSTLMFPFITFWQAFALKSVVHFWFLNPFVQMKESDMWEKMLTPLFIAGIVHFIVYCVFG